MIRLSRAFHAEHGIRLYFAWDTNSLYLAACVEDGHLWADGDGAGAGNPWDSSNDDSIEWYFDLNNSRDNYLQPNDRFLALNIGNKTDPVSGSGIVSRYSFNQGNGSGGATGVSGGMPGGIKYKTTYSGTVNNDSDTDTGYTMEVAIPWTALTIPSPNDGDSIGINTIVISDDTGGTRNWSDNRTTNPAPLRFTIPIRPDEYVELACGDQDSSQSGLRGPVNYAVLQFHKKKDSVAPGSVGSLVIDKVRPFSAQLSWVSTGDNGTHGTCAGFDIRYATSEITAANLASATSWPQEFFPNPAGSNQSIRVMGLVPGTNYWFAVRARDAKGNLGVASIAGPVSTPTPSEAGIPVSNGLYRGAVRVAPGGRYFMTEDGANFIPIGHHFIMEDQATRCLYPAPVWTGSALHNFSTDPGAMQTLTNYLDKLAASGVTVMRIFLEDLNLPPMGGGNYNAANGTYWIEYPSGTYNTQMAAFFTNLLALCSQRGIYVTPTPFDTYHYPSSFQKTALGTSNGGPLSNINNFFASQAVLDMCKARWTWLIAAIKASGYEDTIFGYDVLNEWDSWGWMRADPDPNTDGAIRAAFMRQLANHVKTLDPDHLVFSSNTTLDPRGALATLSYYDTVFDATLPHLYLPGNREPWNNPAQYHGTAVVAEQTRTVAWYTLNRLNHMPVLDGEWGPSDGWMPNPANPAYFSNFTEDDDNRFTRYLWFTELCSGAAGPGIRLQQGVRGGATFGLFLSDYMLGVQSTLSHFVENGSITPTLNFTSFPTDNWRGNSFVNNTSARVIVCSCSDGKSGLAYLYQDKNQTTGTVINAILRVEGLQTTAAQYVADFWQTTSNQTAATHSVTGQLINGAIEFSIPAFDDDWAVRFTRILKTSFFEGSVYVGSNWKWLDNFGYYTDAFYPWIFHNEHGWVYCSPDGDNMYFYTLDLGWLFTSRTLYPSLYRFSSGAWLWYLMGSSHPRWFNNLTTGTWEQH